MKKHINRGGERGGGKREKKVKSGDGGYIYNLLLWEFSTGRAGAMRDPFLRRFARTERTAFIMSVGASICLPMLRSVCRCFGLSPVRR